MLLCKVFRNVSLALSLGTAVACGGAEQRPEGAPLEGPAVLVSYAAADFADIPAFFEDDGDRLIWLTRAGALHRIAKDGTGSVRVALDPRRPRALSVTETHAYWAVDSSSAEHLPGGLLRAPKQGGSVEPIVTGDILDFAVDSSGVYWTERGASDQRVIRALGHDDKQPRTLANDRQAGAIAVDAANVYFSASESKGPATTIYRMPKSGGAATAVGTDGDTLPLGDFATLTVVGSHVYWSAQGRIHRVPTSGGAVERIVGSIRLSPMRADIKSVYGFDGKKLVKGPLAGGSPQDMLISDREVQALVIDQNAAFWIDSKSDCLGWKSDGKTESCVRYDHTVRLRRVAK